MGCQVPTLHQYREPTVRFVVCSQMPSALKTGFVSGSIGNSVINLPVDASQTLAFSPVGSGQPLLVTTQRPSGLTST